MSSIKMKKGLSLLLAIIMIFTMLPTTIFTLGANENLPVMKAYSYISASALPEYHQYRGTIVTATFLDKIDTTGAVASWDISASAATGEVKAWVKLNEEETALAGADRHDLYIGGNGGVAANENSTQVFSLFPKLKKVNGLENYHTDNVKNLSWFFEGCSSLESVDLSSFNTSNVTNLSYFMIDCISLKSVDFSNWDTSKVTTMYSMFKNCHEIEPLDLSSFDTSKVTTMQYMFYKCKKLTHIYAGDGWTTEAIKNISEGVFNCCYAMFGVTEEEYENLTYQPPASAAKATFEEGGYLTYKAPDAIKEYTVTYEYTGNIPANAPEYETMTYEEGTNVIVESNPSVESYIFSGWSSTDADITGGSFTLNNDVVITGNWTKLYKVEYEYDETIENVTTPEGAPELPAAVYYKAGDEVDLLGIPYVDRHIFIGWYTEDADIAPIFTMPENDVVIYGYFKIPVESIEILDTEDIILNVDDSTRVNVFVKPEDATIKEVVYHSSDESVVKIDKYNNIIAVGEGTATITVSSADDPTKKDTIEVTVKKPVTELTVTPEEIIMREDGSGKITVTVNEDATNKEVVFEPQDETIVKVDEYGNITPVGPGTTTITVSSVDNPDKKVVVTVTVKNSVTEIYAEDMELIVGEEKPVGATVNEDATNKELAYEVENTGVAKVDSEGNIIAVGEGKTTVTITSKDDPSIKKIIEVTVVAKYNVTYEYIGEVHPENEPDAPTKATYDKGTTVYVSDAPYVEGYVFSGWTTNDAEVKEGKFVINSNVHFVGSWTKINYYNVSYVYTGDVPTNAPKYETVTYKEGTKVTVEETPSVDGYIFSGWSTNDADITNGNFDIYKDVEIVGHWTKINYYNVIYKYEGDVPTTATLPEAKTYEEGSNVIVESNPSVDGYIFSGWSTDDADITTGNFTINNDVEIVGRWTKINYYNVTYKYEGDIPTTATLPEAKTYEEGSNVIVESNPTVDGYIFSGWSTNDADITSGSFTLNNNVVIVGNWSKIPEYTVTYKYTGEVPANAPVYEVKSYRDGTTVKVETVPYVDGYIFSGWSSTDADITSGSFTLNNDVVIVGNWSKIPEYTVTYKYTGEVPANAPVYEVKSYRDGTTVKVETVPFVDGYVFSGWDSTDIDTSKESFVINNNVVITGNWKKITTYTVTYKYKGEVPEGAPAVPETKTYEAGTEVTVAPYPASTPGKAIFLGWKNGDVQVAENSKFVINGDVTFVGEWHVFVSEVHAPENMEIVLGMETNIGAYVTVGAANQKLHYRSDNEAVAKVDAEGNITANGTGTAKIYVTADANADIFAVVTVTVVDEPEGEGEHYMVFGKTEKIGWYTVSFDGGETWRTVFGNSNHVVKHGSEVIIKANDVFGDPFTFYINGKAVTPDENGYVRVVLDDFVLVGALGIPVIAPDGYEALNWFQQIIQAIRDFFAKIASWFKK